MPSQSEAAYAFYAAGSGLTPTANFSFHEHKLAYLKSHGATGSTVADLMASLYGSQGEYAYLRAQTGAVGTLDQLRSAYYAGTSGGGGGGSTVGIYDTSTYDSTAIYA
jgi:hypothetical protein